MPIDMHSHWYPESLVEALRRWLFFTRVIRRMMVAVFEIVKISEFP